MRPPSYDSPVSKHQFRVPKDADGLRLDQCLARCVPELSRRTARLALDLGAVFVDRKRVKVASRVVIPGQEVLVHLGGAFERASRKTGRAAREGDELALPPLEVLHEDADIVVVHKAAGVLAAPTPESDRNNLVSQLRSRPSGCEVFVVHRLDLQTSGVLVFAKTQSANRVLAETFRLHTLLRIYDVLVAGVVTEHTQTLDSEIRGKHAVTHLRRLQQYDQFCHVEAELETGRTHQIRIHLERLGHPVLADPRYGPPREPWHPARLALHARKLAFAHPSSGLAMNFEVRLPDDLSAYVGAASCS
jgi:23S rRNA pseudouridine1911/1915/1917 synthase